MTGTRRGYTLLEMSVVLVILALAGAVAIPAFAAWRPATGVAAATGALRAAAQLASERAVSAGVATELVIDAPAARAWLHPRDTVFALVVPAECRLVGGARQMVRFAPDGRTSGTLPSVECGADRAQVVVDPLSGAVEVAR
jgi:general secretion pathway protein H